jgi:hypothetical protein
VINYTHRGLGSELLPDQLGSELLPATAPVNAPFWGRTVFFLLGFVLSTEAKANKTKKATERRKRENRKTVFSISSDPGKMEKVHRLNWVAINLNPSWY